MMHFFCLLFLIATVDVSGLVWNKMLIGILCDILCMEATPYADIRSVTLLYQNFSL